MLLVEHGPAPEELSKAIVQLKNTPDAICNYENLPNLKDSDKSTKEVILDQLLMEQGHLCAYCMCSIDNSSGVEHPAHVEHWYPQSKGCDDERSLDYRNMLAVCDGGRGMRERDQTCDTRKAHKIMDLDPTNRSHIETLFYDGEGNIRSADSNLDDCLNKILNLNHRHPLLIRKKLLDTANEHIEGLRERYGFDHGSIASTLRKELAGLERRTDSRSPFVGVTIWRFHEYVDLLEQKQELS